MQRDRRVVQQGLSRKGFKEKETGHHRNVGKLRNTRKKHAHRRDRERAGHCPTPLTMLITRWRQAGHAIGTPGKTREKTSVRTRISRGSNYKSLTSELLGKMARQCELELQDFLRLIDCSLCREAYEARLDHKGKL